MNNSHNSTDDLLDMARERVAPRPGPSPLQAGETAGSGALTATNLTFLGENGEALHWFRWGIDTFDDPSAIFY